jgi:hypothetical protein
MNMAEIIQAYHNEEITPEQASLLLRMKGYQQPADIILLINE